MAHVQRWLRSELGRRGLRYGAVSLVSVILGLFVIGLTFGLLGWAARSANYLAFAVVIVPSFWLNRRWTWGKRGSSRVLGDALRFCIIAMVGFVLSTWTMVAAEAAAERLTSLRGVATLLVMAGSLAAYGALWVARFLLLDRFVFGSSTRTERAR